MLVAVPRAVGVLRRAVPGEGRIADGARGGGTAQVLAKDLFAEGGDVPRGDRGDPGRDRAAAVCQDPGAAVSANRQMRFQSTFSGEREGRVGGYQS